MTIDDLTTTCPNCNGTGQDPEDVARAARPANHSGFGVRVVTSSIGRCGHSFCKNGKVLTDTGRMILELVQAYHGDPRCTILPNRFTSN